MRRNLKTLLFLAAAIALASVVPHMVGPYRVEVLILFMINLILVVSYRIPTTTGDWSLSHVVLMGCGAYTTALLSKWHAWIRVLHSLFRAWRIRAPYLDQVPLSVWRTARHDRHPLGRAGINRFL